MSWEAWLCVGLIVLMAGAMLRRLAGPDTVLLAGLAMVMGMRFFSNRFPDAPEAVAGFGSKAVVTIGVLFVLAEGLRQTGAMSLLTMPVLGKPNSLPAAQARLMLPVAGLSAFLNNTPIVAMLMPVVSDWCRRTGLNPGKLFIPLSYAAIMGGSCTLIGTATNVYVYGEYQSAVAANPALSGSALGMFSISWVAVPAAIIGIGFIILASRWLLPMRDSSSSNENARQFTFELMVDHQGNADGKTIEQAGLRQLAGAFLIAIERAGDRRVAIGPNTVLRGGDALVFAGILESLHDVEQTRGISRSETQTPTESGQIVEVVVADRGPLTGKSIREGRFRSYYNAVVLAVHRGGEHLDKKIGDIVLRPGDVLLLEADDQFAARFHNRPDFYMVNEVGAPQQVRSGRAWIALFLLAATVVAATSGEMELVTAALLGGGLMVLTGCCTPHEARSSINWRVLIMMGAAIGFSKALSTTGAADAAATQIVSLIDPSSPQLILIAIYLVAMLLTSIIGPIPTAGLLFPVVSTICATQGYSLTPFAIALMMTAAASFASPSAYQTNLMVYSVGGYRPSDYLRIGLPLNFIVMAITVTLVPLIWPFNLS